MELCRVPIVAWSAWAPNILLAFASTYTFLAFPVIRLTRWTVLSFAGRLPVAYTLYPIHPIFYKYITLSRQLSHCMLHTIHRRHSDVSRRHSAFSALGVIIFTLFTMHHRYRRWYICIMLLRFLIRTIVSIPDLYKFWNILLWQNNVLSVQKKGIIETSIFRWYCMRSSASTVSS